MNVYVNILKLLKLFLNLIYVLIFCSVGYILLINNEYLNIWNENCKLLNDVYFVRFFNIM